jgi:hypothetical protein
LTLEEVLVIRFRVSSIMLCLLIIVAVAPSAWSQAPVDPQSLIGEWSGSWTGSHGGVGGGGTGKYYLTIERVEGEKVFAKWETSSKRGGGANSVTGRLSGNQLKIGKTEFTIDGNTMQGTAPDRKISLTKENS